MVLVGLIALAVSVAFLGLSRYTAWKDLISRWFGSSSDKPVKDDADGRTREENGTSGSLVKKKKLESGPTLNLPAPKNNAAEQGPAGNSPKPLPSMLPPPTKVSVSTRGMPPPGRLPQAQSSGLMPPPSVQASALRPLPRMNGGLNPPPSAASSLRAPPSSGRPNANPSLSPMLEASTSTLPPAKRPSRKVILEPGYSPLDWANLTRSPPSASFLRGKEVPPHLIRVTPSDLKKRNGRRGNDAWGTFQNRVYNLTPYLKFHPGGVGELMRGAGKVGEAERLFNEIHPWVNWEGMLGECLVGILVSEEEERARQATGNPMDEMD